MQQGFIFYREQQQHGVTFIRCLPVNSDEDHAEERCGHIAVEEEWEQATQRLAEDPRLVDVARRRQRQIEGAEEQIGAGQTQDERRRGVRAQFTAPDQSGYRQRITFNLNKTEGFN